MSHRGGRESGTGRQCLDIDHGRVWRQGQRWKLNGLERSTCGRDGNSSLLVVRWESRRSPWGPSRPARDSMFEVLLDGFLARRPGSVIAGSNVLECHSRAGRLPTTASGPSSREWAHARTRKNARLIQEPPFGFSGATRTSTIVCRRLSFGYDGSERRSPLKRERRACGHRKVVRSEARTTPTPGTFAQWFQSIEDQACKRRHGLIGAFPTGQNHCAKVLVCGLPVPAAGCRP